MQGVHGGGVNSGCCVGEVDVQSSLSAEVFSLIAINAILRMQCFLSRPLSNQNEAGYCLSVPERTVSEVWQYDMVKETYSILYLVMVVKTD